MDVMFYEVYEEEGKALKRHLPQGVKAGFSKKTIQSDSAADPPSQVISTRTQSIIPPAWKGKLSGILTRSSGYDHLFPVMTWPKSPACGYLPSYCSRAVAEHALMAIFALAKKLNKQRKQFATFNRDGLTGMECSGRNLLVVGVGRIGGEVVSLASGIGMKVKGVDLVRRLKTVAYVALEEGIPSADVIICALPLTQKTRGLLNYASLSRAKKGALFVNVSRGEISPVRDLKRLLDEGILGGIALDVYEEEGLFADTLRTKRGALSESGKIVLSLEKDDRVILTPHNAFNTEEALERKARESCEAVSAFLRTGAFPNPVPETPAD